MEEQGVEVKYDVLLKRVHDHIVENYKTVTEFLQHPDFVSCGFLDTDKERTKVNSYLSLPREGEKMVQSLPLQPINY